MNYLFEFNAMDLAGKAHLVRTKPTVPIIIKEKNMSNQNKLLRAIFKYLKMNDNKNKSKYDMLLLEIMIAEQLDNCTSTVSFETEQRIYVLNHSSKIYGLILYVEMTDLHWREYVRNSIEEYKHRFAGKYMSVVVVARSEVDATYATHEKISKIEELEIREVLSELGLCGKDCSVIFCDPSDCLRANQKDSPLYLPIKELLKNIDVYFETPERN